jgi:hypothetical protein
MPHRGTLQDSSLLEQRREAQPPDVRKGAGGQNYASFLMRLENSTHTTPRVPIGNKGASLYLRLPSALDAQGSEGVENGLSACCAAIDPWAVAGTGREVAVAA